MAAVTTTAVKRTKAPTATVPAREPAETPTRPARAQRKQTGARIAGQRRTDVAAASEVGVTAPEQKEWSYPVAHALVAAERAVRRNSVNVRLPLVGDLHLPAAEELAFAAGVAALAVIGVVEWPIALLLVIGHALATNQHNKVVKAFGQALAEA